MENERLVQWFKNGDHPDDHVGEPVLDIGKLCELHPELLSQGDEWVILKDVDIPPEAYYNRIEGAVVRFFRRPEPEFRGFHSKCGRTWHDHGWIDDGSNDENGLAQGITVCPGDWIKR